YKGKFPSTYEGLLALKGVGPYTAAAIASFCYQLPYPVVAGNVYRVLARVSANHTAIDSTQGKQLFYEMAFAALDKKSPGIYNQAIMDFGATVCKPLAPLCNECTMQKICTAYNTATVNLLPVKEKLLQKKTRWFTYFIFEAHGKWLLHKRIENDIWENLYEFYLQETATHIDWNETKVKEFLLHQLNIPQAEIIQITPAQPQQLTHRLIKGWFIKVALKKIPASFHHAEYEWVSPQALQQYSFPKFIHQYFDAGKK
ncbi:MAG TPA: NUDIX domain-containing protein, partial [Chitinophagaceae bacterium]|nr:NUDIX domain-containing protein [Chitinophagaceae bacterium]